MRKPVKYRLLFLFIAIACYTIGFKFIPETTSAELGVYPVIYASIVYFALLPLLYWFMIIKAGKQKAWKLIIIFSLSSAIARYSFPEEIAQHFEFILWLRYPIIAILLIIELYLMFIIVKGLWQARKLTGDPRISVLGKYQDEKKQGLALTLATEPASWYYAIPRLSRRHIKAIDKITLMSGNAWHIALIIFSLFSLATISYQLLVQWSETAAIIAATFILYGFIMLIANYRLSRHYSLYIQDEKLIINNTIFNFMVVPLADIASVSLQNETTNANNSQQVDQNTKTIPANDLVTAKLDQSETLEQTETLADNQVNSEANSNEVLKIGRSNHHNIKITFKQPIKYWGMMGSFIESFDEVLLNVEQPNQVICALSVINSPKPQ